MNELKFFGFCIIVGIAIFMGVGCAPLYGPAPHRPTVGKISFEMSTPPEQVQNIAQDLSTIENSTWTSPDPELLRIMNIPSTTGSAMRTWLEDRIKLIVPESFQAQPRTRNESILFTYDFPGLLPILDSGRETIENGATLGAMLANNLGSTLYLSGKIQNQLLSLEVDGQRIPITSPRVGIMQIGPSFFNMEPAIGLGPELYLKFKTYFRLAVLFHEAKHSDGHGRSLGFFHNLCPVGHTYAGHDVCDYSLNGSYSVSGYFLKSLLDSTPELRANPNFLHAIRIVYADSLDRIVRTVPTLPEMRYQNAPAYGPVTNWEDAPEGRF